MKTTINIAGRVSLLIAVAGLVSCGNTTPTQTTSEHANSMGQTERFTNNEMSKPMNDPSPTQTEADVGNIAPAQEAVVVAETDTLDVPTAQPTADFPPNSFLGNPGGPIANPEDALDFDEKYFTSSNPYLGTPPYYCSPKYSPNIVSSISACHPYLNYYGTSWGYYKYLPRLWGGGGRYPGYRVRRHVGRIGYYDDDDDDTENRGPRRRRGGKKGRR